MTFKEVSGKEFADLMQDCIDDPATAEATLSAMRDSDIQHQTDALAWALKEQLITQDEWEAWRIEYARKDGTNGMLAVLAARQHLLERAQGPADKIIYMIPEHDPLYENRTEILKRFGIILHTPKSFMREQRANQ